MKCLLLSLQQLLRLIVLFFLCPRGRGGVGGGSKLCGLSRRRLRRGSRWPVFSPLRSLSRSLSAECQVSFGLFPSSPFFLLLLFGFHVDVISKLCLWLSPFVFDWSTRRVGFSKKKKKQEIKNNMDTVAIGCFEKRKKKTLFLWNRGENNNNN